MGKINVLFNGKPLFDWQGDPEHVDAMEAPLRKLAEVGNTTVDVLTMSTVIGMARHGGFFTPNQQLELMMATYFVLNMPTQNPDHPGRYRDYLPAWDFIFDIFDADDEARTFSMAIQGVLDGVKHEWPRFN